MNEGASAPEKTSAARSATRAKTAPLVLSFAVMSRSDSNSPAVAAPRFSFPLGRSPWLAAAFALAGAAALTGIWAIIALPPWVRVALSTLAAWRAWAAISRHALRRGKQAHLEVFFDADDSAAGPNSRKKLRASGAVRSRMAGGEMFRALVEGMFLSAPLVVLRAREVRPADVGTPVRSGIFPFNFLSKWFRRGGGGDRSANRRRETIMIPADCMDAESHRQFRIRARRAWAASAEILHGGDSHPAADPDSQASAGMASFFLRFLRRLTRERGGKKIESPRH